MKPRFLPIISLVIVVVFFFNPFFLQGKLPIPSDAIVGLYHPFRDFYAKEYPNGIPFKNSLITDPVRQQYPWRELVISLEKKLELPLWNPYSFSGTPLLANFQSAVFYPFNLLFFVLPFNIGWSVLIMLQPLLAGIFLYWYLRNLSIHRPASFLGSFVFAFCGFSVAWMEWGTILHVAIWLPLILLSIDKIFFYFSENSKFNPFDKLRSSTPRLRLVEVDAERSRSIKTQNSKLPFDSAQGRHIKNKKFLLWSFIFIFSLVSSFFAGHLQTFFYIFVLSMLYLGVQWIQSGRNFKFLILFFIFYFLFFILTAVQWIPTLQLILLSARNVDQIAWTKEGWFIPWQHLIQFIAPDFFGNPTTLNYWGVWNYGEFVGYVGVAPFIMSIYALFFRHDKKTFFFGVIFFISLIFSLPTILGKLPYTLNIPFLSTAQPTRLLFITDFSLAILAAFGLDYFMRASKKEILYPIIFLGFVLGGLWIFVMFGSSLIKISSENLSVSRNNLILPTILLFTAIFTICVSFVNKSKVIQTILLTCFFIITIFDLLRFAFKFTPFIEQQYLFPQTKTISFLQKNLGNFRLMTTDSRILPPNFSTVYRLQSVDGYDPLYLRRYGELIAASERGEPNISPPFGFNRIITPHNYDSKIIDLLGVKYILSLTDLSSPELKKVFQEGQTRVYENKNVLPRAFFVEKLVQAHNKYETIESIFDQDFNFKRSAIVEITKGGESIPPLRWKTGAAEVIHYSENKIVIGTENTEDGFLILTDTFYPTWKAKVGNNLTQIHRTDYNFRGIVVPEGKHTITFYNSLL